MQIIASSAGAWIRNQGFNSVNISSFPFSDSTASALANKLVSSPRDQDLAQHPCGQLNLLVKLNRSDHVCTKLK